MTQTRVFFSRLLEPLLRRKRDRELAEGSCCEAFWFGRARGIR